MNTNSIKFATAIALALAATQASVQAKDKTIVGPFENNRCLEVKTPKDIVTPGDPPTIHRDAFKKLEAKVITCPPPRPNESRIEPVTIPKPRN